MYYYLIHSLAPLMFRTGKPFSAQASAKDVSFPLPSAGAGLIRALSIAQGQSDFDKNRCDLEDEDYKRLLNIKSYGVHLVRYSDDELVAGKAELLLPKPANSLYIEENDKIQLVRLAPHAFDDDCGSDLPAGLLHVQTVDDTGKPLTVKGKPKAGANFWTIEDIKRWHEGEALDFKTVNDKGLQSIPTDTRTHTALSDERQTADDGKLFQTISYDLGYQARQADAVGERGFNDKRLGFILISEQALTEDLATFGGERRLSQFLPLATTFMPKPTQNDVDAINQAGGFLLNFITPATFAKGYRPAWLDDNLQGELPNSNVSVQLVACAIERWQAVSGWDSLVGETDKTGTPKATRKAVVAGSVYWFKLLKPMDLATLERLHQPLADNDYDQNDGFGLAYVAPYVPTV